MRLREGRGERTEGRGGMSSNMPGDLICKYCQTQFQITFTKFTWEGGNAQGHLEAKWSEVFGRLVICSW